MASAVRRSIDVCVEPGDFVLFYGSLARVLRVIKGPYGLASVEVRHLEKPPRPAELVDVLPASYVQPIAKPDKYIAEVRKELERRGVNPADSQLQEAVEHAFIAVWHHGLRDHFFGNTPASNAKLEALMGILYRDRAECPLPLGF